MFKSLSNWLNARTGHRDAIHAVFEEPIPGGASWRYVIGSSLLVCFVVEAVTGLILMFGYSPSAETAWGSVYYISEHTDLGWFIRGLHRFTTFAMIVLLGLHLIQSTFTGAYRAPREFVWWFGLALMLLTVALGLTGNMLPWDQHGYWAAVVETLIAGSVPIIGPSLQKLAAGGSFCGNLTVTRMYALHVGLLPILTVLCLLGHILSLRRQGMTPVQPDENSESGWPRQTFRRLLLSSIVLGVVVYVTLINHGAPLEAPADPNSEGYPARPEWYFVWLSQLLKLCHGGNEWIATVAVPTGILGFLCLMPLLGHVLPKKLAHFVSCVFVLCLVGGVSYLTYLGYERDAKDPLFAKGKQKAEEAKERAFQLAALGISPEGSSSILRTDPLYHGGQVFEKKCASCHYFNGKGLEHTPQSAPDLHDFASKAWIRGLLENPRADRYFGKAAGHTGMARWKKGSKLTSKQLDDVADFVFQLTQIPDDMEPEEWLEQPKVSGHPGMEAFTNECGKCHKVRELTEGGDEAPDLYAWGSMRWTTRMINNPNAHGFYKYLEDKQKMPAFAEQTTPNDVATVIRYIKGDYHKPGEEAKAVATPSPAPSLSH